MERFAKVRHEAMSFHLRLQEKYDLQKDDSILPDGRIKRAKKRITNKVVDDILSGIKHRGIMAAMRQEVETRESHEHAGQS